jgi:Ca2+-dependent lipid-binding protein
MVSIGFGKLDLATLEKDNLHDLSIDILNEKNKVMGAVKISLTVSGAENSKGKEDKFNHARDNNTYGILRSFKNSNDVGILKVTLHRAANLIACDSFGKSDPYVYVDVGNQS